MAASAGFLAAAGLAAEKADELVVGTVRDVHRAVADRAWRPGETAAGGRLTGHRVHDRIAGAAYRGVGWSLRGAGRGLRRADRCVEGWVRAPRLEDRAAGRALLAAVNGLIGDRLREEAPELSFDLSVRAGGRDVPPTAAGLSEAFPDATGALVVFLHGLCESEAIWDRRPRRGPDAAPDRQPGSYGERLAADAGWTPVYLRANTGLPIAENGAAVAGLLDTVVARWPVPVHRIALVGHSMGALVLRAACAVTTDAGADGAPVGGAPWADRVTDVVTLGAPHLGAPLERGAALAAHALGRVPESAPLGRILEYRSVGILDLRHGLAADVRHLPHARYHLVAGSLGRSQGLLGRSVALALGDLLVQPRSAFGRPRRDAELFPGADTLLVPGADHFDLANHEDVYRALRGWLGTG